MSTPQTPRDILAERPGSCTSANDVIITIEGCVARVALEEHLQIHHIAQDLEEHKACALKHLLNSNALQPNSDGLQPTSNGLQPDSDGLQRRSSASRHASTHSSIHSFVSLIV